MESKTTYSDRSRPNNHEPRRSESVRDDMCGCTNSHKNSSGLTQHDGKSFVDIVIRKVGNSFIITLHNVEGDSKNPCKGFYPGFESVFSPVPSPLASVSEDAEIVISTSDDIGEVCTEGSDRYIDKLREDLKAFARQQWGVVADCCESTVPKVNNNPDTISAPLRKGEKAPLRRLASSPLFEGKTGNYSHRRSISDGSYEAAQKSLSEDISQIKSSTTTQEQKVETEKPKAKLRRHLSSPSINFTLPAFVHKNKTTDHEVSKEDNVKQVSKPQTSKEKKTAPTKDEGLIQRKKRGGSLKLESRTRRKTSPLHFLQEWRSKKTDQKIEENHPEEENTCDFKSRENIRIRSFSFSEAEHKNRKKCRQIEKDNFQLERHVENNNEIENFVSLTEDDTKQQNDKNRTKVEENTKCVLPVIESEGNSRSLLPIQKETETEMVYDVNIIINDPSAARSRKNKQQKSGTLEKNKKTQEAGKEVFNIVRDSNEMNENEGNEKESMENRNRRDSVENQIQMMKINNPSNARRRQDRKARALPTAKNASPISEVLIQDDISVKSDGDNLITNKSLLNERKQEETTEHLSPLSDSNLKINDPSAARRRINKTLTEQSKIKTREQDVGEGEYEKSGNEQNDIVWERKNMKGKEKELVKNTVMKSEIKHNQSSQNNEKHESVGENKARGENKEFEGHCETDKIHNVASTGTKLNKSEFHDVKERAATEEIERKDKVSSGTNCVGSKHKNKEFCDGKESTAIAEMEKKDKERVEVKTSELGNDELRDVAPLSNEKNLEEVQSLTAKWKTEDDPLQTEKHEKLVNQKIVLIVEKEVRPEKMRRVGRWGDESASCERVINQESSSLWRNDAKVDTASKFSRSHECTTLKKDQSHASDATSNIETKQSQSGEEIQTAREIKLRSNVAQSFIKYKEDLQAVETDILGKIESAFRERKTSHSSTSTYRNNGVNNYVQNRVENFKPKINSQNSTIKGNSSEKGKQSGYLHGQKLCEDLDVSEMIGTCRDKNETSCVENQVIHIGQIHDESTKKQTKETEDERYQEAVSKQSLNLILSQGVSENTTRRRDNTFSGSVMERPKLRKRSSAPEFSAVQPENSSVIYGKKQITENHFDEYSSNFSSEKKIDQGNQVTEILSFPERPKLPKRASAPVISANCLGDIQKYKDNSEMGSFKKHSDLIQGLHLQTLVSSEALALLKESYSKWEMNNRENKTGRKIKEQCTSEEVVVKMEEPIHIERSDKVKHEEVQPQCAPSVCHEEPELNILQSTEMNDISNSGTNDTHETSCRETLNLNNHSTEFNGKDSGLKMLSTEPLEELKKTSELNNLVRDRKSDKEDAPTDGRCLVEDVENKEGAATFIEVTESLKMIHIDSQKKEKTAPLPQRPPLIKHFSASSSPARCRENWPVTTEGKDWESLKGLYLKQPFTSRRGSISLPSSPTVLRMRQTPSTLSVFTFAERNPSINSGLSFSREKTTVSDKAVENETAPGKEKSDELVRHLLSSLEDLDNVGKETVIWRPFRKVDYLEKAQELQEELDKELFKYGFYVERGRDTKKVNGRRIDNTPLLREKDTHQGREEIPKGGDIHFTENENASEKDECLSVGRKQCNGEEAVDVQRPKLVKHSSAPVFKDDDGFQNFYIKCPFQDNRKTQSCPSSPLTRWDPMRPHAECEDKVINFQRKTAKVSFTSEVLINTAITSNDVYELMSLLKDSNTELNKPDKAGLCFLHYAVLARSVHCLTVLLLHGAEVNVQDSQRWTPLHYASYHSYVECAVKLLAVGADISIQTVDRQTVLDVAETEEMITIIGRVAVDNELKSKPVSVLKSHKETSI